MSSNVFEQVAPLTEYDARILRYLVTQTDDPELIAGAAMWSCVEWLRGRGYVVGCETKITEKGRAALAAYVWKTPAS